MIRAAAVQLPAITFTWDGSIDDAREIVAFLKNAIPEENLGGARIHAETGRSAWLEIWILDLTEMGTHLHMRPGDSASIVINPEAGEPIWVIEGDQVPQMTVVLQESHRSIGG